MMHMKKYNHFLAGVVLLLSAFLFSCIEEKEPGKFVGDELISITSILESDTYKENFSKFVELLEVAGHKSTLYAFESRGRGYTLFAPTNAAIDDFVASSAEFDSFESLKSNKAYVTSLVRYHVLMRETSTVDFPFGALPDTTASGDFLTTSFSTDLNSSEPVYLVNNRAKIININVRASNGYIHMIDKVLIPNVYTMKEWLTVNAEIFGLTIFKQAMVETGVIDMMPLYVTREGRTYRNYLTLWVEPDAVFNRKGIFSFDDLKARYDDTGDITDAANGLNRFMRYHIMSSAAYMNDLLYDGSKLFETLADYPLVIANNRFILLNPFGPLNDTIDNKPVNYVSVLFEQSNNTTLNGPIHLIGGLLDLKKTVPSYYTDDFENEPLIQEVRNRFGNSNNIQFFDRYEDLSQMTVAGVPYFLYVIQNFINTRDRVRETDPNVQVTIRDNNLLEFYGDFTISYNTPKIPPGRYRLRVVLNRNQNSGATVQFSWNNLPVGPPIDTSVGANVSIVDLGEVELFDYTSHVFGFDATRSGRFRIFQFNLLPI
jgi:uncharacterized surface protein with fasciclin (FAS1) repeats